MEKTPNILPKNVKVSILTYIMVIGFIIILLMDPVLLHIKDLLTAGVLQSEGSTQNHLKTLLGKSEN